MARRKKYPKLPNGYGSIRYLGKNRRNPYAVHPPTEEFDENGVPKTPKALCYVDDWMKGFAVLTAYKAGTYTPGMEKDLLVVPDPDSKGLVQRILADYSVMCSIDQKAHEKTFAEVYKDFYDYKYNRDKSRQYSEASKNATKMAFKNCPSIHSRTFRSLRHNDLQMVIDSCKLKHASLELIKSLFTQMYAYAEVYELCDKDYSRHLKINIKDDDEHGVPFSSTDLQKLWTHKDDETVELILIMCYSGYRISAYKTLQVNLEERYFLGGVKTNAGKNRMVPIHSGIYELVEKRMRRDGGMLNCTVQSFRNHMASTLLKLEIEKHTPHDCRHTFSALCEEYGVNENDRKRMLGHSFGSDITNGIYGHRSLDDLRVEIEKIKICD